MTSVTYGERIGLEGGRGEGLREAITLARGLKFGESGVSLLLEIEQIEASETLRAIIAPLKTVTTLDEVRAVYARRRIERLCCGEVRHDCRLGTSIDNNR